MKNVSIPPWAGLVLVPLCAYVLNNFVLVAVPYLGVLPDLGFVPYVTTSLGILGLWFAVRGNEERATTCAELCTMSGLMGTMIGLTEFLGEFNKGTHDTTGLLFVFITGYHGIVMASPILFVTLWRKGDEDEDEE